MPYTSQTVVYLGTKYFLDFYLKKLDSLKLRKVAMRGNLPSGIRGTLLRFIMSLIYP